MDKLINGFKGATIKHISKEYIKNIKIPLPSEKCQNQIVKLYEESEININTIEETIKNQEKCLILLKDNGKKIVYKNCMSNKLKI